MQADGQTCCGKVLSVRQMFVACVYWRALGLAWYCQFGRQQFAMDALYLPARALRLLSEFLVVRYDVSLIDEQPAFVYDEPVRVSVFRAALSSDCWKARGASQNPAGARGDVGRRDAELREDVWPGRRLGEPRKLAVWKARGDWKAHERSEVGRWDTERSEGVSQVFSEAPAGRGEFCEAPAGVGVMQSVAAIRGSGALCLATLKTGEPRSTALALVDLQRETLSPLPATTSPELMRALYAVSCNRYAAVPGLPDVVLAACGKTEDDRYSSAALTLHWLDLEDARPRLVRSLVVTARGGDATRAPFLRGGPLAIKAPPVIDDAGDVHLVGDGEENVFIKVCGRSGDVLACFGSQSHQHEHVVPVGAGTWLCLSSSSAAVVSTEPPARRQLSALFPTQETTSRELAPVFFAAAWRVSGDRIVVHELATLRTRLLLLGIVRDHCGSAAPIGLRLLDAVHRPLTARLSVLHPPILEDPDSDALVLTMARPSAYGSMICSATPADRLHLRMARGFCVQPMRKASHFAPICAQALRQQNRRVAAAEIGGASA
jgi:hypothetical protein